MVIRGKCPTPRKKVGVLSIVREAEMSGGNMSGSRDGGLRPEGQNEIPKCHIDLIAKPKCNFVSA